MFLNSSHSYAETVILRAKCAVAMSLLRPQNLLYWGRKCGCGPKFETM